MQISVQYLEPNDTLEHLSPQAAARVLVQAGERIPLSRVLIGWQVTPAVLAACRDAATRMGAAFYRWQPLLSGDGTLLPRSEWAVVGLAGNRVAIDPAVPEFSFMCPNHPDVLEVVLAHLSPILHSGIYDGFFLDRIRFPSPAANPESDWGCFCPHCCRKAREVDLDLPEFRRLILGWLGEPASKVQFVQALLGDLNAIQHPQIHEGFGTFLRFRAQSVAEFLVRIITETRRNGLQVGLDCFSPSLTSLVWQDLHRLGPLADWVKIMTYAHTYAPAGLPHEFLGLANYLARSAGLDLTSALQVLQKASGLRFPVSIEMLQKHGLSSTSLNREIERGISATSTQVFAGIELVELPGIVQLLESQIRKDLAAVKAAHPAGITLSWDLASIPLERLDWVRQVLVDA